MALWVVRAGAHGEYEQKFLEEKRLYLTWDNLNINLASINEWDKLKEILGDTYPDISKKVLGNYAGQITAFYKYMDIKDWVIVSSKYNPIINIGEIVSDYTYDKNANSPYNHFRKVKWIKRDIPR